MQKQTNIAMILTVSRLLMSPFFAYLFFLSSVEARILTFALLILSELSDLFDGYIARKRNEVTDLGKVLDPLADRITHLTIFLCLTWARLVPLYMILIILYREALISTLRTVCAFRSVVVHARTSGKIKTAAMAFGIILVLFLRILEAMEISFPYSLIYFWVFGIITAITFWSAVDYIWANARYIKLNK